MTNDMSNMSLKSDYTCTNSVVVSNGMHLSIKTIGSTALNTPSSFSLQNVLHVPIIKHNLSSVNKFVSDNDVSLIFYANSFTIKGNLSGQILYKGTTRDGFYLIPRSLTIRCQTSSPIINFLVSISMA